LSESKSRRIFNSIAGIYGWFYDYQKRSFIKVIEEVKGDIDITTYKTILDVGCGTGALCSVLASKGLEVTGIDPAEKMLQVAKGKPENSGVEFIQGSVLDGLPFEDNSFNIAIASHVAHGMKAESRKIMYKEMSRVSREHVIIHDYNDRKTPFISFVEWLEGGDYFHFIKHAELEMKDCMKEMENCFSEVRVINIGKNSNWYVCKPSVPVPN
jgi:ubiquinone/menaquinone biosynthesis C-methylase UbiE